MTHPPVKWTAPSPLWPTAVGSGSSNGGNGQSPYRQPAILRFASDDFMEEFMNTVAADPGRLGEWQATPETWRGPATSPIPIKSLPTFAQRLHRLRLGLAAVAEGSRPPAAIPEGAMIPAGDLKLYQPAHQRYYLVTAALVCTRPGLPDRQLNFNAGEQTSYVIRRLQAPQPDLKPTLANLHQFTEYAFVLSAAGNRWQRLGAVGSSATQLLAEGEEKQKLFGVTYGENGRARRILAGMIPVGKREALAAAPLVSDPASDPTAGLPDPRAIDLQATVIQPWEALLGLEASVTDRFGTRAKLEDDLDDADVSASDRAKALAEYDDFLAQTAHQIQGTSFYILLDFADFLQRYLPNVWAALPTGSGASLEPGELALLNGLKTAVAHGQTFAAALHAIVNFRQQLEDAALPYPKGDTIWPTPFSLADAGFLAALPPDELAALVDDALAENEAPANTPALPLAVQQTAVDQSQPAWYIIRCVFERPQCAAQEAFTFSQPTAPFQMASFFDPDAPARPIRISLPLDTSPAGLRKFSKNTAFVISDVLACQMERAGNLSLGDLVLSVLPWPFHKSLPGDDPGSCSETTGLSLGMICTLSIPIITICALILLMIIVTLLDTIFRWLPYFIMCFPLPGLKGKK
ncbi:MAG: hypothetical protein H6659_07335 [Ardenticatenaceae bacterium]|nr:hypothetical protein [Ardenticatenaceae bacterium]